MSMGADTNTPIYQQQITKWIAYIHPLALLCVRKYKFSTVLVQQVIQASLALFSYTVWLMGVGMHSAQ